MIDRVQNPVAGSPGRVLPTRTCPTRIFHPCVVANRRGVLNTWSAADRPPLHRSLTAAAARLLGAAALLLLPREVLTGIEFGLHTLCLDYYHLWHYLQIEKSTL